MSKNKIFCLSYQRCRADHSFCHDNTSSGLQTKKDQKQVVACRRGIRGQAMTSR